MSLLEQVTILYEDDDIVVVTKPAGLIVHSDGKRQEETLADWMLSRYPDSNSVGEPIVLKSGETIIRPGIVHRLDRDTSGAIILAKNQNAFEHLKKQFQDRDIAKEYHTFVYGVLPKKEGTIDRPIGRSRNDFRQWSAQRGARGVLREAITDFLSVYTNKEASFVKVFPKTGRTHQIRVHFKAINHPVVCDSLYASKQKPLLGFERLALHAAQVEFENTKGEIIKVIAPYPEDFNRALEQIQKEG